MNPEVFRVYVREVLLPALTPGGVLVMENLSARKERQTLGVIKEAGMIVRFSGLLTGLQSHRIDVEQSEVDPTQNRSPNQ